jgi:hypothetical protein
LAEKHVKHETDIKTAEETKNQTSVEALLSPEESPIKVKTQYFKSIAVFSLLRKKKQKKKSFFRFFYAIDDQKFFAKFG